MKTFKEFFFDKHGFWPAATGETWQVSYARMAETFADYADQIVAPAVEKATNPLLAFGDETDDQ